MFTKNIFNQKPDALVDMIDKINEADYKLKMEALKGDQHKIDKNKNNKIDAHDFKILRGKKKVNEDEQLDELSKKTLGSYAKKATDDVSYHSFQAGNEVGRGRNETSLKQYKKAMSRQAGVDKAIDRLTKEDTVEEGWDDMLKAAKERSGPKPSGDSGVKKGSRYGGSKQKDKPEQDDDKKKVAEAATMQPKGPARMDVPAYKRMNMKPLSLKDVATKSTLKQSKTPNAVKEESEQIDEALRTVSTHGKGEGQHHAVVKRDVEWNEYQVHYFKDGKHMGEGPVSHHDDKADAQSTADHEVKRMNARKNEDFNLEDMDPALVEEFMQTEEFEQLDELSKKTLGDYVKKASHDVAYKGAMTRQHAKDSDAAKKDERYNDAKKSEDKANKTFAKSWSRRKGMAKAVDRLTKD
jgi:hypothetical protein